MFTDNFPQTYTLKNKKKVVIRLLEAGDEKELNRFFASLPEAEINYFRSDVQNPETIRGWIEDIENKWRVRLVVFYEDQIIAEWAVLHRDFGWTRHVCEIRGMIHPDWRGLGLGNMLIYDLLTIAHELEKEKVIVEVLAQQKLVIQRFEKIGFQQEAFFKNHVKDARGRVSDLIVLSMELEPAWKKMEQLVHDMGDRGC
ncbi:GNAT family N-acetyltransferase [bacterium]|nr:GNAT family N-acetyltransferase [bacterium]